MLFAQAVVEVRGRLDRAVLGVDQVGLSPPLKKSDSPRESGPRPLDNFGYGPCFHHNRAPRTSDTVRRAIRNAGLIPIALIWLSQHAIDRRSAYAKRRGNRGRRFPTRVHPLSQRDFRAIKCLGSPNGLAARPPRLTGSSTPLPTQLQLKLRQARQHASHHPTICWSRDWWPVLTRA